MISSENVGKDKAKGKFPSVCRKGVDNNSILCQFCRLLGA